MTEPLAVGDRELVPDLVQGYVLPRERPFEGRRLSRPFLSPWQYRASPRSAEGRI
jgi:hypothetical protein